MKTNRTRVTTKIEMGNAVFDKGLQSFDAEARLARRGFQVVMATKFSVLRRCWIITYRVDNAAITMNGLV